MCQSGWGLGLLHAVNVNEEDIIEEVEQIRVVVSEEQAVKNVEAGDGIGSSGSRGSTDGMASEVEMVRERKR